MPCPNGELLLEGIENSKTYKSHSKQFCTCIGEIRTLSLELQTKKFKLQLLLPRMMMLSWLMSSRAHANSSDKKVCKRRWG